VDSEADDDHAMSLIDRGVKLAEIERDRLVIERQEAAIVWAAQTAGEAIEHRADCSPVAILGIVVRVTAAGMS
jgi:hypothetical protein